MDKMLIMYQLQDQRYSADVGAWIADRFVEPSQQAISH